MEFFHKKKVDPVEKQTSPKLCGMGALSLLQIPLCPYIYEVQYITVKIDTFQKWYEKAFITEKVLHKIETFLKKSNWQLRLKIYVISCKQGYLKVLIHNEVNFNAFPLVEK